MDNIIIDFPENRKICVNGEEFEVILNDFEVLELASSLSEELARMDGQPAEKVVKTLKRALGALDEILGEGATKRLTKGRAVSVAFMLDGLITPILSAVLAGAGAEYSKRVSEKYGVGGDETA